MDDSEGFLGPELTGFVEEHVSSLLAWDLLLFFQRNSSDVLDIEALSARLARPATEVAPEVEVLCAAGILETAGGLVRYRPQPRLAGLIDAFAEACRHRGHRLSLIALVLKKINPNFQT